MKIRKTIGVISLSVILQFVLYSCKTVDIYKNEELSALIIKLLKNPEDIRIIKTKYNKYYNDNIFNMTSKGIDDIIDFIKTNEVSNNNIDIDDLNTMNPKNKTPNFTKLSTKEYSQCKATSIMYKNNNIRIIFVYVYYNNKYCINIISETSEGVD